MSEADDDDLPLDVSSIGDQSFDLELEAPRAASGARGAAHAQLLAYRRAAELLLPELGNAGNESLAFPFLSLWRQHIELYLRFLLELAWQVRGHTGRAPATRGLLQLWNTLRPFVEPDVPHAMIDEIARVVSDLAEIEPRAAEARYADDDSGAGLVESLARVPDGFSAKRFAGVATQVSELFGGIQAEYSRLVDSAELR